MHMDVHTGLTGRLPNIDPDIVTISGYIPINAVLRPINQLIDGPSLLNRHVKVAGDMALRNDDDMALSEPVAIVSRVGIFVLSDNSIWKAQFAVGHAPSLADAQA